MSITLTKEKHFVVLLSIIDLDGGATKKEVLDNIQIQNYYSFSQVDLAMKTNRHELYWRNDLAFVRKFLVSKGYIDDSVHNLWNITSEGMSYIQTLSESIINTPETEFNKLTSIARIKALEIFKSNINDYDNLQNELLEDQMTLPNETQEAFAKRIKRYKKIIDELKEKYHGCCQIENCGFTFAKKNGENYAEGHHLIPLASGGSQNSENVVILCANHHRMFHFAKVEIGQLESNKKRETRLNGIKVNIVYMS